MIKRDKDLYILIKASTHQEDITNINVYTSNNRVPNTWSKIQGWKEIQLGLH